MFFTVRLKLTLHFNFFICIFCRAGRERAYKYELLPHDRGWCLHFYHSFGGGLYDECLQKAKEVILVLYGEYFLKGKQVLLIFIISLYFINFFDRKQYVFI